MSRSIQRCKSLVKATRLNTNFTISLLKASHMMRCSQTVQKSTIRFSFRRNTTRWNRILSLKATKTSLHQDRKLFNLSDSLSRASTGLWMWQTALNHRLTSQTSLFLLTSHRSLTLRSTRSGTSHLTKSECCMSSTKLNCRLWKKNCCQHALTSLRVWIRCHLEGSFLRILKTRN